MAGAASESSATYEEFPWSRGRQNTVVLLSGSFAHQVHLLSVEGRVHVIFPRFLSLNSECRDLIQLRPC